MWEPLSSAANGNEWTAASTSITQLKGEHTVTCCDRYDLLPLALITDPIRSDNASKILPPNFPAVGGVEGKEMTFIAASKNQLPGR